MSIARRTLLPLGVLASVVLALSGTWLAINYEPQGFFADRNASGTIGAIHLVAAGVLGIVVLVGAAIAIANALQRLIEDRVVVSTVAVVATGLVIGAFVSGVLLPWDVAGSFDADGPGSLPRGVFLTDIAVVFVGSRLLTPGEYSRIAWLHVVVLPVLAVIVGLCAAQLVIRARRTAESTSASVP